MNMLCEGGAFFETPPPAFEDGMFKPYPATGARTLDSRVSFYYSYTLDSPGMIMRIPGVGSQYLMRFRRLQTATRTTAARPTRSRCPRASPPRRSGR